MLSFLDVIVLGANQVTNVSGVEVVRVMNGLTRIIQHHMDIE